MFGALVSLLGFVAIATIDTPCDVSKTIWLVIICTRVWTRENRGPRDHQTIVALKSIINPKLQQQLREIRHAIADGNNRPKNNVSRVLNLYEYASKTNRCRCAIFTGSELQNAIMLNDYQLKQGMNENIAGSYRDESPIKHR
jgi:hypothetical protein